MATIRTVRALATVAALPLTALLFSGVAQADTGSGAWAGRGSNASSASIVGSGVADDNFGNSTTSQQLATGFGASNENSTANVTGFGNRVDQSHHTTVITFHRLW
ncbi:hypothetical protein [Streptomyces sp. TP-A0874]|uniref:hypothetical protein n=1 Tax=Streptomyces sp. TP-A0874 TaxID=549819 RepID=UPI000853431B|nr:hypothetical protein [Streptomyces sp. TP-A0874]